MFLAQISLLIVIVLSLISRDLPLMQLGAIQFRKNLKLNTRPKKLARFRHALFLRATTVRREFKYAKNWSWGVWWRETVFYCAVGAQSAQLPCILLYKIGMRGK
jgi:hypothetical protein